MLPVTLRDDICSQCFRHANKFSKYVTNKLYISHLNKCLLMYNDDDDMTVIMPKVTKIPDSHTTTLDNISKFTRT